MNTETRKRAFFWWPLMFLSGMAALTYEICWIRMFALGLGHEMPATAAVISAFFGGLAVGAWVLDGPIRRSNSPVVFYTALELAIGIWALVTMALIPFINNHLGSLTGPTPGIVTHWTVAFAVPFFALAPSTIAMGATIPAMDQIVTNLLGRGRWIGTIYAANTFGAVCGTLAATFILLPMLGFTQTLIFAAVLNLICAAIAYLCFSRTRSDSASPSDSASRSAPASQSVPLGRLGVLLFFTGLLGIGFEVLGTRSMAQVQENTVYSFASVLSVYLFGTFLGAAAYQRWLGRLDQGSLLTYLVGLLAIACLTGVLVLSQCARLHQTILTFLGPGLSSAVATEAALATLVFGVPTLLMGMIFTLLAQAWRDQRGSVGKALCINTVGAAAAAPLFASLVLPALGAKWSLIFVAGGYLILLFLIRTPEHPPHGSAPSRRRKKRRHVDHPITQPRLHPTYLFVGSAAVLGIIAAGTDLRFVRPLEGGEVIAYRDGVMAAVAVVTDSNDQRFLKVNDRFRMGGTANPANERRLGHIPLLLHPAPQSALLLGLGTGNTLAACAVHPGLEAVAVELIPEVVDLQHYFAESTGDFSRCPLLQIQVGDARRYVRFANREYDVIIADLFHPARDGAGSLYTREHFLAVRDRLSDGGLFCQWLPLYQMDDYCLRIVVQTYLGVFPNARAYLSTLDINRPILGLVGSEMDRSYAADWFDRRLKNPELRQDVMKSGVTDAVSFFGLAVASPQRLRSFANSAPINTDDHARITFSAPQFIYSDQPPGYVNLLRLLDTNQIVTSSQVRDQLGHVARYESSRDIFLRAEVQRVSGHMQAALDGYIRSVEQNPDFDLGYLVAVMHAKSLARTKARATAIDVLKRLVRTSPNRPEAANLLRQLENGNP